MGLKKSLLPDDDKCFYYSVFKAQAIGQIVIDTDAKIVAANTWIFRTFNIVPKPILNDTFGALFNCAALEKGMCCGQSPMCEHCRLDNFLHSVFEHRLNAFLVKYKFITDGGVREKYLSLSGCSMAYRGKQYASVSFTDVTYSKHKENNLRKQLEYDFSTGAKNKRALFNATRSLLAENTNFSIAMLDFDYFKRINDTCGHIKGDMVLAQFSKIVYKNIRRDDLFARYGGEEFILIFKRTSVNEAVEIIERIQKELKGYFAGRIQHPVTFSAGLLYVDRKEVVKDSTELFNRVDKLLYAAKMSGRDKIIIGKFS